MNIMQIVPALEVGGVERGTIDLALSLAKLGHCTIIVSNGGRLVREIERDGITHISLPVHRKSVSSLSLVPEIARLLKYHEIDVLHASSRVPAWLGFFASRLTGTPFVTSCHGFYSRHLLSRVMGWGKLVMVISKAIEKRMEEVFKVPKEKIRLVYRGLDLAAYPYYPDKYDKKRDSFVIINIGRLSSIKGQYEFIEAMKLVMDKIENAEAWIVGGAEEGKEYNLESMKNLAVRLKIERHIKFLGLRDDTADLLKEADCLVLSTNVPEGFGRVVIEAGAIGTAVCASEAGGVAEIVEDGVSGLLFPPKDPARMADAILRMLGDSDLRKRSAANLRKKVEENFTLDKMVHQTLAVYEEVSSKRGRPTLL